MRSVEIVKLISAQRLKKARALLFFLVCTSDQPHRTEKIIDLLWRQAEHKKASLSFRQTVRQIRLSIKDTPEIAIETGSGQVMLTWPDSSDFLSNMAQKVRPEFWSPENCRMVRLCFAQMEMLLGISGSLDSWLNIQKNRFQSELRATLDASYANENKTKQAIDSAEFAVEIEPSNERAVRFLMQHFWHKHSPTRAVELYNTLYHYLDEAYDQEPDTETQSLVAAIKMDPERQIHSTWQQDIRPKLTVSIDQTSFPSDSVQDKSFLNVLASDLRRRLSRFREWQVLDKQMSETAYLVLGLQLLPIAGVKTLHIEVTRPSTGELVWSDVIKSPTEGWDNKVHPVLTNIARALSVEVADRSAVSPVADSYDYWLRSQALLDAWSPDTESEALRMLKQVTKDAPKFGPAHAELAGALNVRHVLLPGTNQTEDVRQLALHHAIEAVTIDPLDTRAHRVLAWCYCHKSEFELSEFHFEQALDLNQNNPLTLASAALGFAFTSRLERAANLGKRVRDQKEGMEPFHKIYLAATYYLCGEYSFAEQFCADGEGLMTTVGGWHSAALWRLGKHEDAVARFAKFEEDIRPMWQGKTELGAQSLIDWFVSVFPLREESVRNDLREILQAVANF